MISHRDEGNQRTRVRSEDRLEGESLTPPRAIPCAIPLHSPPVLLEGEMLIPQGAPGLVLFAHGSGSSRHSPRNKAVAAFLHRAGLGTLLFDLLTPEEEEAERYTLHLRFDIGFLAGRLGAATRWVRSQPGVDRLRLGYFGSSTGAAAALVASTQSGCPIDAIVSRGGRPDLAARVFSQIQAPTLLIVGGYDEEVIRLNEAAYERLSCEKALEIVPGATHLFEESGTLESVAALAADWFSRHLKSHPPSAAETGTQKVRPEYAP